MADEFKTIRENLFKVLSGALVGGASTTADIGDEDEEEGEGANGSKSRPLLDPAQARVLLGALFARAGKGKDEVIQILAREIGQAMAAMIKEPLAQLAKHQKLQISFEFVPKDGERPAAGEADQPGTLAAQRLKKKAGGAAPAKKRSAPPRQRSDEDDE